MPKNGFFDLFFFQKLAWCRDMLLIVCGHCFPISCIKNDKSDFFLKHLQFIPFIKLIANFLLDMFEAVLVIFNRPVFWQDQKKYSVGALPLNATLASSDYLQR